MTPSDNPHLDRIIADFLEESLAGKEPDRQALLDAHPEFADELKSFFANHDGMKNTASEDAIRPPEVANEEPTISPIHDPGNEATTPLNCSDPLGDDGRPTVRYFGDYELLEEIARGGMGVVYKARQVNLNRIVALKMILAGQLATEEDVRRFYAEAKAAAILQHPNVVTIHEIGEHEGQHYFSMDMIEGKSLRDLVRDQPLPPRKAAQYLAIVADAIEYAHQHGILHRDLKPSNILIDAKDEPHIADFGLAKRVEQDSSLTGMRQILGTPSYMSPEQALGKHAQIGPESDVYSLGAILYELLTGRPPYQAANAFETLKQVTDTHPISPKRLNPAIPLDLETVCLKCLAEQPRHRYRTAGELCEELDRFLDGKPVIARPVGGVVRAWRWCRRNQTTAALVATCLAVVSIGFATITWQWLRAEHRTAQLRSHLSRTITDPAAVTQTKVAAAASLWKLSGQAEEVVPALIEALKAPDKLLRENASEVLADIGPPARVAIPALIEAAKNPMGHGHSEFLHGRRYEFHGAPAWAVARIGLEPSHRPSIITAQEECVSDSDPFNDYLFFQLLSIIDRDPKNAIPRNLEDIRVGSAGRRLWAQEKLMRLAREDKSALPALVTGLGDKSPDVRRWCASGMIKVSPFDDEFRPELIGALQDEEVSVRWRAVIALGACGPRARDAAEALQEAGEDMVTRDAALWALNEISRDASREFTQVSLPRSKSRQTTSHVLEFGRALRGELGPGWRGYDRARRRRGREAVVAATQKWLAAMIDNERSDRAHLVRAWATPYNVAKETRFNLMRERIPQQIPVVVAAFIHLLGDESQRVRRTAIRHITVLGSYADNALPSLIVSLEDPRPSIISEAALTLAHIGPEAACAVPALAEASRRSEGSTLATVEFATAIIQYRNADAVGAVERLVQVEGDSAGSGVSPLHIRALERLLQTTGAPIPHPYRLRAVELLGDLASVIEASSSESARDSLYREATAALLRALDDPYAEVRLRAIHHLRKTGGVAYDVVKLQALAERDPEQSVRDMAGETLKELRASGHFLP